MSAQPAWKYCRAFNVCEVISSTLTRDIVILILRDKTLLLPFDCHGFFMFLCRPSERINGHVFITQAIWVIIFQNVHHGSLNQNNCMTQYGIYCSFTYTAQLFSTLMIIRRRNQHMRPWTTKPVLSRWGIFVAIAKNTMYVSKLQIFISWQKSLGY